LYRYLVERLQLSVEADPPPAMRAGAVGRGARVHSSIRRTRTVPVSSGGDYFSGGSGGGGGGGGGGGSGSGGTSNHGHYHHEPEQSLQQSHSMQQLPASCGGGYEVGLHR
jgi:hypothetical protein